MLNIRNIIGGGKNRQSNIELARVLSMFYILVIHANMVSLDRPTPIDLENHSLSVFVRYLFESIGIISVDVFVLISGWFMVKPKIKGVLSFVFQVIFLWGIGYYIMLILGRAEFNIKGILTCFAFTSWDWFIKAYMMLFILAPILNVFVQNSTEKIQRNVLIWFFLFMSTYGLFGGARKFFDFGYGPLTFIGLYLLSQYVHNTSKLEGTPYLIRRIFSFNKYTDLCIVFLCAITNTIIGVVSLRFQLPLYGFVYAYINPLVIIGALYFLLFFSKLSIKQNSLINWLAGSSFAVYLIHSQIDIRNVFTLCIRTLYDSNQGVLCVITIFFFLIMVYIGSVLIDQIRLIIWNLLNIKIKNGKL